MAILIEHSLVIPYGAQRWPFARLSSSKLMKTNQGSDGLLPLAMINRERHMPLRLNTMTYTFAEPPNLHGMTELSERLVFLRDHFKSFCGIWDKLPRLFLDAYFRHVSDAVEGAAEALRPRCAAHGGLFRHRDWSYSALAPLPLAHLHAPIEPRSDDTIDPTDLVRVDFAFWSGEQIHPVDIVGTDDNRLRREARERLRQHGFAVIEIPGEALRRDGESVLGDLLPAAFSEFWRSEELPCSPFFMGSMAEIATPEKAV